LILQLPSAHGLALLVGKMLFRRKTAVKTDFIKFAVLIIGYFVIERKIENEKHDQIDHCAAYGAAYDPMPVCLQKWRS
jgi:hypothetical protein